MSEAKCKKNQCADEKKKKYINPVISWSILGVELAVCIVLAIIFWL